MKKQTKGIFPLRYNPEKNMKEEIIKWLEGLNQYKRLIKEIKLGKLTIDKSGERIIVNIDITPIKLIEKIKINYETYKKES